MNLKQDTSDSIEVLRSCLFNELNEKGYALIENIEKHKAYAIMKSMGTIFQQESGKEHPVQYEEGYDDFRYSKSLNEIGPHTEYPYLETPPTFQVLFCVKPSDCNLGYTYTCNTKNLIETFSKEELELVTSRAINFKANKDLEDLKMKTNLFPIVSKNNKDAYIFRFSHNLMYYGDINANIHSEKRGSYLSELENPYFAEIVQKILDYLNTNKQVWKIPKNGLLIWNNHYVVHWRSSYCDKTRKLIRYLIE